ncbi:ABC transporter permease [Pseudoalteromonas luteoviolacea]|uniref:ABC transporter permease n=1 Tax=Pseudoalteromonas luteoviolacea H33 TaxID=1365251 RepID=A0A167DRN4_9GAMM|nr:ABC transporter permease [Pseudoalteromonas luteoviolacea]KZN49259.1 hypothetical protein N476_19620 [Pseudoalteromonas luteoviolacea H33]KZN74938.1 hypothetical protein N477_21170 [Pseudoalteromonas luteoviolacea H33-S]
MSIFREFRLALSSLSQVKGYSSAIILTLGVTLGALVAIFMVNYQLLSAPLPYDNQDRLFISKGNSLKDGEIRFSDSSPYPALMNAYSFSDSDFEQKALINFNVDIIRNLPASPRVNLSYITPEYLDMLQTPFALGRNFNAREGLEAKAPVAIISYDAWDKLFGKRQDAVGKTLRFGETNFKIIGITAKEFVEPELVSIGRLTDVWLSWDFNLTEEGWRHSWGGQLSNHHLIGLLKPGVNPQQVSHKLTSRLNNQYRKELAGRSFFKSSSIEFKLTSFREKIIGDSYQQTLLLFTGVFLLLMIAVANTMNLILARTANRQRIMAIQAALGAQKSDLFRSTLIEMSLLMTATVLFSLAFSYMGIDYIKQLQLDWLPRANELSFNWLSVAFSALVSSLIALLTSLLVNRQIDYRKLSQMMLSGGKGTALQVSKKVRNILILSQVALTATMLCVSIQVFHQSMSNIIQPSGLATNNVYQVKVDIGIARLASTKVLGENLKALRNQFTENPKIKNASIAMGFPLSESTDEHFFSYLSEDAEFQKQQQGVVSLVDENYLDILKFELIKGKTFSASDYDNAKNVIIINETFADKLALEEEIINKRYFWINAPGDSPYEVVGVVRDLTLPGKEELPRVFIPYMAFDFPEILIEVMPNQNLSAIELNQMMARVNKEFKVSKLIDITDAHDRLVHHDKFLAGAAAVLTLLTLFLASVGVYGILAYSIQLRRSELGIRMAIGATPATIYLEIIRENFTTVLAGFVAAGVIVTGLWLWLENTSFVDEISLWGALFPVLLIVILTALASLFSAWRIISKPAIHSLQNAQ